MTVKNHARGEGHLCVGGPLDGQAVVKPDHVKRFNVPLAPEPFGLYDHSSVAVTQSITIVTYTLTRTADGGLVWQA